MGKGRRSPRIKNTSPEKREEKRLRGIVKVATEAGLPEAQRFAGHLAIEITAIDGKPRPMRETVRKLTRVEILARSGVLDQHEARACEWYAEKRAMAFDTVGCTANYQGAGGGGFGSRDLLARYKAQADARIDYAIGHSHIPVMLVEMFEAIVCRNETVSGVASIAFELKRSQAEHRVRVALKLCANRLHMGIAPLLPAC